MKNDSVKAFFTAGELASVFGVSKQSLLYYDRIKLLCPDYVGDNGYRHYSIKKYLDLEIIINMRALDISIADIKDYLLHRNRDKLEEILAKRDRECDALVATCNRTKAYIARARALLETRPQYLLGQIMLSFKTLARMELVEVPARISGKAKVAMFARLTKQKFTDESALDKRVGWVVRQEDFFGGQHPGKAWAYFSYAAPHQNQADAVTSFGTLEAELDGMEQEQPETGADRYPKPHTTDAPVKILNNREKYTGGGYPLPERKVRHPRKRRESSDAPIPATGTRTAAGAVLFGTLLYAGGRAGRAGARLFAA